MTNLYICMKFFLIEIVDPGYINRSGRQGCVSARLQTVQPHPKLNPVVGMNYEAKDICEGSVSCFQVALAGTKTEDMRDQYSSLLGATRVK